MAEISDASKNTIVNSCTPDPMTDFFAHVGRGGAVGIGVGAIGGKIAPLGGVTGLMGMAEGLPTGMVNGAVAESIRILEGNTADVDCIANTMQRQSHGSITPNDKITAIQHCTEGTQNNPWVSGAIGAGEGAAVGGAIGSRFGSIGGPIGVLSGSLIGFGTGIANAELANLTGETTNVSCVADKLQQASKKPEPAPAPAYSPPVQPQQTPMCSYSDGYHRPYIAPCPPR